MKKSDKGTDKFFIVLFGQAIFFVSAFPNFSAKTLGFINYLLIKKQFLVLGVPNFKKGNLLTSLGLERCPCIKAGRYTIRS